MKKIIAAALSILVGAFGYTIVDSAIEDRVATLESEVVELREEVSRYHPQNLTTTDPYEGSEVFTTEEPNYTTESQTQTAENFTEFKVGSYLTESSNSQHKFLLRKWSNGRVQYISPSQYGNSVSQFVVITDPQDGRLEPTTKQGIISVINPTQTAMFTNNNEITDPDDDRITVGTTTALTYEDYFLYVTEATAQWTETEEETSFSYRYDQDYSQVSKKYTTKYNYITVTYKGYTDTQLAGTKIKFILGNSWQQKSISNNTIDKDGCFEFEVIYLSNNTPYSFHINSIKIY